MDKICPSSFSDSHKALVNSVDVYFFSTGLLDFVHQQYDVHGIIEILYLLYFKTVNMDNRFISNFGCSKKTVDGRFYAETEHVMFEYYLNHSFFTKKQAHEKLCWP